MIININFPINLPNFFITGSFDKIVVHPILGILIGIVATIVIAVIIVILLIRNRIRAHSRTRPSSSNIHGQPNNENFPQPELSASIVSTGNEHLIISAAANSSIPSLNNGDLQLKKIKHELKDNYTNHNNHKFKKKTSTKKQKSDQNNCKNGTLFYLIIFQLDIFNLFSICSKIS